MMHPPTQTNDPLYDLPLVLAGPLLQHTEPTSVTVWIALQAACQVELKVYATQADQILEEVLLVGQRQTVALGEALHVVAVTARSDSGFRLSSDSRRPTPYPKPSTKPSAPPHFPPLKSATSPTANRPLPYRPIASKTCNSPTAPAANPTDEVSMLCPF
jgi:hypothetical protein